MRPAWVVLVCLVAVALSALAGVVLASTIFQTVPIAATVTILPSGLPEDVDGDGSVDERDLALVVANLGTTVPPGDPTDVNGDGQVDILDLAAVALRFGTGSS